MQGGHLNAKNSQIQVSAFDSNYIALFYEDNKQQVMLIYLCSRVSSMSMCRQILTATEYLMHGNNPWAQHSLNALLLNSIRVLLDNFRKSVIAL